MKAADLMAVVPAAPVIDKVGRSVTEAAKGNLVRSGAAAGAALVALSAASAAASALRPRTESR